MYSGLRIPQHVTPYDVVQAVWCALISSLLLTRRIALNRPLNNYYIVCRSGGLQNGPARCHLVQDDAAILKANISGELVWEVGSASTMTGRPLKSATPAWHILRSERRQPSRWQLGPRSLGPKQSCLPHHLHGVAGGRCQDFA